MTVVQLLPALEQGGVERVVCDLNRVVAAAGWRSVVVSRGGRLAARIAADGGRHAALDLKSKNPLTAPFRACALRRLLAEAAAADASTVVCTHSRVPAWLFVLANRALRLPWISYAHGANSVSRYSAVMTRGDRVVAPSRFLADFLLANYPDATLARRLRVISPCVDLARFDPGRLDAGVVADRRRAWGIGEGTFVAMSVGRISPVKGFGNVIRDFAAGRAAADGAARLVIVGGADERHAGHLASLKSLAASLGVAGRVVFAGSEAHMPEALSLAGEVVVGNTEKPETFGLSVVEALAMDRPVRLLRRFGGPAEILSAVEAQGAARTRDAVRALYGFDALSGRSRALCEEVAAAARPRRVRRGGP